VFHVRYELNSYILFRRNMLKDYIVERTLSHNWGERGHVVTVHATYVARRQVILNEAFS
jgi:hypothetical protein